MNTCEWTEGQPGQSAAHPASRAVTVATPQRVDAKLHVDMQLSAASSGARPSTQVLSGSGLCSEHCEAAEAV